MIIELEIFSCRDCPHIETGSDYSTDGWDRGCDWFCKKMNKKKIVGFVEWHDNPKIPIWCPFMNKKNEQKESATT